ncbi:thioredoxin family protein [Ascidiimonas aurantiaca]|uniref:thioredoxin family protein n=1 Tax=Ascidiimonas aurantiaca TaxID=1685432 RepID=UPI0030ED5510
MRVNILYTALLICVVGITSSFNTPVEKINWMTWEEAVARASQDENPKKIFVDVYTDWCGWCKKMDKTTFGNMEVASYMTQNFYMVKMDAEGKQDIVFKDKTYKFVPNGRRGYHELAATLLNGRLSYPSTVFLDEKVQIITVVPGYQDANNFLKIAKYIGDDIFKGTTWQEYNKAGR